MKREILRTYSPEGFILDHGILRGKVFGFPLAAKVAAESRARKDHLEGHYSTHDAAKILGKTPQAIDYLIKAGKLPVVHVQTGKIQKKYVPCEAVDALVR